jgi:hypothetical protein
LDCGESRRRITALGVGLSFPSQEVPNHEIRPYSCLQGMLERQVKRCRHPQSGDALALSPQSKAPENSD